MIWKSASLLWSRIEAASDTSTKIKLSRACARRIVCWITRGMRLKLRTSKFGSRLWSKRDSRSDSGSTERPDAESGVGKRQPVKNRTLMRRLESLEAQILPPRSLHVIRIEYVDPTGAVVGDSYMVQPSPGNRKRLRRKRGYAPAMPANDAAPNLKHRAGDRL